MNSLRPILFFAFLLHACAPGNPPSTANLPGIPNISPADKAKIGRKIWQNESGGSIDGLTAWNAGEEFPSLGIGHFIWYPAGFLGPFRESWPDFVLFAKRNGENPPVIASLADAPWRSRAEFQAQFRSSAMSALRSWLAKTVSLQTDFIIARSRASLPSILAAVPASERQRIQENYRKVSSSPQGIYALIDYVNFKGDGTSPSEKYQGQGWGLLQVLGGMKPSSSGSASATEFAASAKRTLSRRIQNSPLERGESRWLPGWHNRCDTYARGL
jgi:hypothetical protein